MEVRFDDLHTTTRRAVSRRLLGLERTNFLGAIKRKEQSSVRHTYHLQCTDESPGGARTIRRVHAVIVHRMTGSRLGALRWKEDQLGPAQAIVVHGERHDSGHAEPWFSPHHAQSAPCPMTCERESANTRHPMPKIARLRNAIGTVIAATVNRYRARHREIVSLRRRQSVRARPRPREDRSEPYCKTCAMAIAETAKDPDDPAPIVSARRFGEALHIDLQTLAQQAHVHRNTISRQPASESVQRFLRDALRVIRAASDLTGDISKALFWYRNETLPVFDYKTAEQLVSDGCADDVLRFVASLEAGAAG